MTGSRLSATSGTWRRLIVAVIVTAALVMTLGTPSTAAASPAACRVRNTETGTTHGALQAAVEAARGGDRLVVRGACAGTAVLDRRLTVAGRQTSRAGRPTLSGLGKGRVLVVAEGAEVVVRNLVIQRGRAPRGGCILNRGDLILRDVIVRLCTSPSFMGYGAGAHNRGRLTMNGASRITKNFADPGPGGIVNKGVLVLNDHSSIGGNSGVYTSGIVNSGDLTLNDHSAISHNEANEHAAVENGGMLTLNDSSTISDNWNGGVGVGPGATLVLNDQSTISGNDAEGGGGVRNRGGTVNLNDYSSIRGNTAAYGAAGISVTEGGTLTLNDSSAIRGNRVTMGGHAGGVFLGAGTLTLNGASSIRGNVAEPGSEGDGGGGVYSDSRSAGQESIVTLNDSSSVRNNTVTAGSGGGVWMHGGTLELNGSSSISGNRAAEGPGGLYHRKGHEVGVVCRPWGNVRRNAPYDCLVGSR